MSVCPKCNQRLIRTKTGAGILFRCRKCDGRAVSVSVLRRAIPRGYVNGLWLRARQGEGVPGKQCPICQKRMVEIPVPLEKQQMPLDVCAGCRFVWFDPHEFQQLPPQPRTDKKTERQQLPPKVREAMALAELRQDELRRRKGDFGGGGLAEEGPEETWKTIPALFGMPVEYEVNPIRSWPWMTWGLAALMVLTFALTFADLPAAVQELGLIPAQAWRHGGVTLITSFFLHGGLMHLIGNLYFLLIFGDNVEDQVGPFRYWLLVAAAALAGDLLHIMADPRDMIPCVGASGGISGLIVFYALEFPRARLGFMFRWWWHFRWVYVPAWFALIGWLVLQALLAHQQLAGVSSVSALAHLGGAGVGFCAWLFRGRNRSLRADNPLAALRNPNFKR